MNGHSHLPTFTIRTGTPNKNITYPFITTKISLDCSRTVEKIVLTFVVNYNVTYIHIKFTLK